jgi:hypothetical protein
MLGAAVPKTAINEDGNPQTRKGHIRYAARFLEDIEVDPVAQATSMKLSPQCDFDISSLSAAPSPCGDWSPVTRAECGHREVLVSVSSGRDRREVCVDAARDGATEVDGNRVAD